MSGDFNFHINDSSNADAAKFFNLLEIFHLAQHVDQPTYQNRRILDLMITKASVTILSNVLVSDPAFSDHCAVFGTLQIKKPLFEKIISNCRNLKGIVYDTFLNDVSSSSLVKSDSDDLVGIIDQYDSQLSSILNSHAPLEERIYHSSSFFSMVLV